MSAEIIGRVKQFAVTSCGELCENNPTQLPKVQANNDQVAIILQIVFGVIGLIALVMIILSGLKLTTSFGGNPEAVSKARKTLIYAVAGLIVAVSAELIVALVLNRL